MIEKPSNEFRFSRQKRLTQRAPDGWESPRFQAVCVAQAGSGKVALSHPAHPRVTQTVGGRTCVTENLFIYQ